MSGSGVAATAAGFGALVCLAVYVALHKHKSVDPTKTKTFLMMGVFFGINGIVGTLIHTLGMKLGGILNGPVAVLFGAGVPAAILVGLFVWLWLELRPKHKSPHKFLPWVGATAVVMIFIVGGTIAGYGQQVGNSTLTDVGTTVNDSLTAFH